VIALVGWKYFSLNTINIISFPHGLQGFAEKSVGELDYPYVLFVFTLASFRINLFVSERQIALHHC
jgi:hypothetical protein